MSDTSNLNSIIRQQRKSFRFSKNSNEKQVPRVTRFVTTSSAKLGKKSAPGNDVDSSNIRIESYNDKADHKFMNKSVHQLVNDVNYNSFSGSRSNSRSSKLKKDYIDIRALKIKIKEEKNNETNNSKSFSSGFEGLLKKHNLTDSLNKNTNEDILQKLKINKTIEIPKKQIVVEKNTKSVNEKRPLQKANSSAKKTTRKSAKKIDSDLFKTPSKKSIFDDLS